MADQKKKRERFTSPRGVCVYPRVDGKPDTKFDTGGVWQVQLAYEGDTAEQFTAQIDKWMQKSMAWAKDQDKFEGKKLILSDPPYQPEMERDKNNKIIEDSPTGRTLVRFKLKATGTRKDKTTYAQHVTVLHADLTPFPDSRVGGGTEGKVGYEVAPFAMPVTQGSDKGKIACGVSLKLRVLQVLKYVAWEGGNDPKTFDMEPEEGFTGSDEPVTTTTEDSEDEEQPAKATPKATVKTGKSAPKAKDADEEDEDEF